MVHIFLQLVANRISPKKLADPITMLRSESDLMFNNHSTRHKHDVSYKGMETMIAKGKEKGSTTYMLLLATMY
jgi:hypothetical protein